MRSCFLRSKNIYTESNEPDTVVIAYQMCGKILLLFCFEVIILTQKPNTHAVLYIHRCQRTYVLFHAASNGCVYVALGTLESSRQTAIASTVYKYRLQCIDFP